MLVFGYTFTAGWAEMAVVIVHGGRDIVFGGRDILKTNVFGPHFLAGRSRVPQSCPFEHTICPPFVAINRPRPNQSCPNALASLRPTHSRPVATSPLSLISDDGAGSR
jgi:hypothetical protein